MNLAKLKTILHTNKQAQKGLGFFLLLLVLAGGIYLLTAKDTSRDTSGKQQTTVDMLTIGRADLYKRISLTGQTVPLSQVDLAAKYQGRILAVNVELGQQVSEGDVLLVQDTQDADISIAQNQAAYSQAAADSVTTQASFYANYEKAQADYRKAVATEQRSQRLYNVGGISLEQMESIQQQTADAKGALDALANQMQNGLAASIQSSQAAAQKAQHTVQSMEKQRSDLLLRAPRSGTIGYRQAEVGNLAAAGQKLLSIVDTSQMYVDCQVAEGDLAALALGMPVQVQLEALGQTLPGTITYISPSIDTQTLAFSLRISLLPPLPATLRGGLFSRVVLQLPLRQQVLVIPKEALLEKNGQTYVFVINGSNKIEQRLVQVGARGDRQLEILQGLQAGDNIAVSNLSRLRPDMVISPHPVTLNAAGDAS